MITVKPFLTAAGLETPHERIKLVRHVDHAGKPLRKMIEDGKFDFHQAEQLAEKKPFHHGEVIVSFLSDPPVEWAPQWG